MDRVVVNGLELAFERQGSGPDLVLLHGAVCDGRVWRRALDALSDSFSVIAWDTPGCGQSSDPPEHFRMPDFAACLSGFVDAVGLNRPHVLGHSWGSTLALELYRQRPSAVRNLLLVGAYAGWAGSLEPDEVARRLSFALRAAELPPGRFDPASMPGLFSDALPHETATELTTIMSEIRPAGTTTMAYALAEADLRGVLPTIDVPTLLLYGENDERSPLSVARELNVRIPGSTLVIMSGLGHECPLESPDTFAAEVRGFLATCVN